MKLYATPLSHFSRKVRILLDGLGLEYKLIDVGDVSQISDEAFANNPNMNVPVLLDEEHWLLESDYIAAYVVRKHDIADRFAVLTTNPDQLNARALMNGAMERDVTRLLAARTGVPIDEYAFFDKAQSVIVGCLTWLESNTVIFNSEQPGYLEFHLVCMLDHLQYYNSVPLEYPKLREIMERANMLDYVRASAPGASNKRAGGTNS